MLRRFIALCVLCSFLFAGAGVLAQDGSLTELERQLEKLRNQRNSSMEELQNTREKLMKQKKQISEIEQQKGTYLELIQQYEDALVQTRRNLRWLRKRENKAEKQLKKLQKQQESLRGKLQSVQKRLGARLRALYMQGDLLHHSMLLEADSTGDFLLRSSYYQEILQHDVEMIQSFRDNFEQLQDRKEKQKQVVQKRRRLRQSVEQTKREEQSLLEGYQQLIKNLEDKKQYHRERLQELEQEQNNLQQLMKGLRQEQTATQRRLKELKHQFAANRGELPWPVDSREVIREFGEIEEEGIEFNNPGIDIAVESGAPVRVVGKGTVVHIGVVRGRSNVVIVQHDELHMTVYGSLQEVEVEKNERLETGDVVGYAGQSTGFDRSLVHFQIAEKQKLHNPLDWLK